MGVLAFLATNERDLHMARRRRRRSSGAKNATAVIKKGSRVIRRFRYHKGKTPARLAPYARAAKACAEDGLKVGTKAMGRCIVNKAKRRR